MKRDKPRTIPNYLSNKPNNKRGIPDSVANAIIKEEPELKKYSVGHEFYNESLCQIKSMDATPLRKILENYKRVSKCSTPTEVRKILTDVKNVNNRDHYKKYFASLSPDIDLLEFDASSYRGFFFIDTSRKLINMVAIDIHPENKKNYS